MSETLPLERTEDISTEKPTSPALKDINILVDNPEISTLISAEYEKLSELGRVLLLKSFTENTEKIQLFADPDNKDNASMKTLIKAIIDEVKVGEKEVKVVEKEVKVVEKEVKVVEKEVKVGEKEVKVVEKEKSLLKEARTQRDEAYKLFGDTEGKGFEKKFGDKAIKWKSEAIARVQTEAKKTGKELSGEELKTQVDISILVSNREAIADGLSGKERTEFLKIAGQLHTSADSLHIPFDTTLRKEPDITSEGEKRITSEILGFKSGETLTRVGSKFQYGDQVVDISTNPPTRSIEQNGVRIILADTNGTKERNYQEQQSYQEKKNTLTREIGELSKDIESNRENMLEKYKKLGDMKKDYEEGPAGSINQTELKVLIEKTEKELEDFKKKTEKLTLLKTQLQILENGEVERTRNYQESLKSETEASRDNIRFFSSIGLDSLGQSGIDEIVKHINEKRKGQSGAGEIALQKSFGNTEKKDLAQVIRNLVGIDPFTKDIPPRLQNSITPDNIRGLLIGSGVLSQTGEFNKNRFENKTRTPVALDNSPKE